MKEVDRRTVLSSSLLATVSAGASRAFASHLATPRGLDTTALRHLDKRAHDTKSDAVLVYHQGNPVYEFYSGKPEPIFAMSCTKSIVALAIGQAIGEGKIKGLDQPVSDFFPEMKQGRKASMTLRHVLTMTSGIQNTGSGDEIYPAPDIVKLAVAAELTTAPGATFDYNNKSVNLLSGIIHIATKQPLDDYVRDRFFEPMGIESWNWARDDDGNASAMADLALYPEDFAKFGTLVLQNGRWKDKQIVPASWVSQLGQQSQPYEPRYGLLWWRFPSSSMGMLSADRVAALDKAGLGSDFVKALRQLQGRRFESMQQWHSALAQVLPDWEKEAPRYPSIIDFYATNAPTWRFSDFDGFGAEGSYGQYLTVFPARGLAAVRMVKPFDDFTYNNNRFESFPDIVRSLVT